MLQNDNLYVILDNGVVFVFRNVCQLYGEYLSCVNQGKQFRISHSNA